VADPSAGRYCGRALPAGTGGRIPRRAEYMEVSTMTNSNGWIARRIPLARFIAQALLGGAVLLASLPAFAGPIGWNAFGGWYTDPRDFLVGGGARISVASITVNPNAEYIFTENAMTYTLNIDATMAVMPLAVASIYAGGGYAYTSSDPDNGESSTDSGINAIAGAGLNAIPLKPYGQIKWTFLPDDTPFSFSFGVRF
jgi:hypothetical protein